MTEFMLGVAIGLSIAAAGVLIGKLVKRRREQLARDYDDFINRSPGRQP